MKETVDAAPWRGGSFEASQLGDLTCALEY